jgi:hypothetical protein
LLFFTSILFTIFSTFSDVTFWNPNFPFNSTLLFSCIAVILGAQVTSLFKKNDPLVISNYRPISILPIFSKLFEKVIETQLNDFFDSIFNPYLCAFQRGHGCQTMLLRLQYTCVNSNIYQCWQLMRCYYRLTHLYYFSRYTICPCCFFLHLFYSWFFPQAFDCLPHSILLDKLSAYGVSSQSVSLLKSYLSNRKQQIKVNSILSDWADIQKGVPQGSIASKVEMRIS